MVKLRKLFISLFLLLMAAMAGAQVHDDVGKQALPDSIRNDYEEWLRNEPPRPAPHDSTALRPLPPRIDMPEPRELGPKKAPVSVVIMTPNYAPICSWLIKVTGWRSSARHRSAEP